MSLELDFLCETERRFNPSSADFLVLPLAEKADLRNKDLSFFGAIIRDSSSIGE